MQAIRDVLPASFLQTMQRKLGTEETLRQLWPALVGPTLAAQIQPRQLRGKTLLIAIPDREWHAPIISLQSTIIESVNRLSGRGASGSPIVNAIELVIEPGTVRQSGAAREPNHSDPKGMRTVRRTEPAESIGDLEHTKIADASLRAAFLRSAQKYFERTGRVESGTRRTEDIVR